ncbi:MAG: P-loop NTPase fold protein [Patescibacteria group bacterium]|nr:P-loop NTPase fold protein [Patescibacteria group bacterium]
MKIFKNKKVEIDIEKAKEALKIFVLVILIGKVFVFVVDKIEVKFEGFTELIFILIIVSIAFVPLFWSRISGYLVDEKRKGKLFLWVSLLLAIVFLFLSDLRHSLLGDEFLKFVVNFWNLFLYFYFFIFLGVVVWYGELFLIKKDDKKDKKNEPIFISDEPAESDELGLKEDAKVFAKNMLNNNSTDPIVFGLDSPWGSGKTSYVNFCRKYWESDECNQKPLILNFEPLIYKGQQDLFCKFVEELTNLINREIYSPKLNSLFRKYIKKIKEVELSLGFFGKINFNGSRDSYETVFENLERILKNLDKKIIVVIDDLDRLQLEDVKIMLGIVRNVFHLPNITFLLCYDTQNINTFEIPLKNKVTNCDDDKSCFEFEKLNNEKIVEYFEKIVSVKNTIVPDKIRLKNVLVKKLLSTENIEKRLDRKNKESLSKIEKENLLELEKSINYIFDNEFGSIGFWFCDLRKLKRFANYILGTKILEPNYSVMDIDWCYLIKFIILYINYPQVFREIYLEEANGEKGVFSIKTRPFEPNSDSKTDKDPYINDPGFDKYLKSVSTPCKELLKNLFEVETIKGSGKEFFESEGVVSESGSILDEVAFAKKHPAFNGGDWGIKYANLGQYLEVTICGKMPEPIRQDSFYERNILMIDRDELKIEDVFAGTVKEEEMNRLNKKIFMLKKHGEFPFDRFFIILEKQFRQGNLDNLKKIILNSIEYLSENIAKFSYVDEFYGIYAGFRTSAVMYILRILEGFWWKEDSRDRDNASDEKVKKIADKIFEAGGVLEELGKEKKGVLGIIDLLRFRHYCAHGNDLFNLQRGLAVYDTSLDRDSQGNLLNDPINRGRMISQKVFEIFDEDFIQKKKNIFEEFENVEEGFFGEFGDKIKKDFDKKKKEAKTELEEIKADWKLELERLKNRYVGFAIFQLSNTRGYTGEIYCGYYDRKSDKDWGGIGEEMQEYLFDFCFNIRKEKKNAIRFIDFLLTRMEEKHEIRKSEYVPKLDDYKNILDMHKLAKYWHENEKEIKNISNSKKYEGKKIYTFNYIASYKEHLELLLDELDKLLWSIYMENKKEQFLLSEPENIKTKK